ncbi:MAG: ABC transporter substrate-binding protein [Nocardioides sp.]|uniref:ABC transporter substrate-binding protein n=1 Tax=Nocardioides sp. TaxID=35761 RepID=UPI0039E6F76E
MQHTPRPGVRRRAVLGLALALPLAFAGCGGSDGGDSADGTTSISVGVIPIIDVAPIYLGVKQGFFSDEGLDLKLTTAQGGAAIVPGVTSGQFQFGFSNAVSLMLAQSKGIDLDIVAAGVASTGKDGEDFGGIVVPADSAIASAKDLAGKKVAVNTLSNINTVTTNAAVTADGGDPSSIDYVELGFPDALAAVKSGDVDAAQLVEPFLTAALNAGDKLVSSNYVATAPDLQFADYFTSADYAKDHADVVTRFTTAMNKSLDYAQQNPDAVRAILSTYTDLDEATQAAVILPTWSSEISTDSLTTLAGLMQKDGLTSTEVDPSTMLP